MWKTAALNSTLLLRVNQDISSFNKFVLTFPPLLCALLQEPKELHEHFIIAFTLLLTNVWLLVCLHYLILSFLIFISFFIVFYFWKEV